MQTARDCASGYLSSLPGSVRVDVATVGGRGVDWRDDTPRRVTVVRALPRAQAESDATSLRNYGVQAWVAVLVRLPRPSGAESARVQQAAVGILTARPATHFAEMHPVTQVRAARGDYHRPKTCAVCVSVFYLVQLSLTWGIF